MTPQDVATVLQMFHSERMTSSIATDAILTMAEADYSQHNAEIVRLRSVINELALPLAELITAYQDADSPAIQDTLKRGRVALSKSMG